MSPSLPQSAEALTRLTWADLEPHFAALKQTALDASNVAAWLDLRQRQG